MAVTRTSLGRMVMAIAFVFGLTVAAPTVRAGDSLYFVPPSATERGALVEGYTQKAGTIHLLKNVTRDRLDAIEGSAKLSALNGSLLAYGLESNTASRISSLMSAAIPATDLYREARSDVLKVLCDVGEGSEQGPGNLDKAPAFITDAVKAALRTEDTTYFLDEGVRRGFWESVGLYDKYTPMQIEYINRVVMPSLAAELVLQDWNGLFHLWQALNGVAADVSLVTAANSTVLDDLTGNVLFYGQEFAAQQDVMNAFSGSTGALGLLHYAAAIVGSGTGDYAKAEGALAGYQEAWQIPPLGIEDPHTFGGTSDPPPGTLPGSGVAEYWFSFKITK